MTRKQALILRLTLLTVSGSGLAAIARAQPVSRMASKDSAITAMATCKLPPISGNQDRVRLVLDGKAAPLAQRKTVFAAYERCAQNGDVNAQDLIGSLYYMGDSLPDALVTRDVNKARLYLSNAAAHGSVEDMAKMAEIEFAGQRYPSAMVWAQLFGHYSGAASDNAKSAGYFAHLLTRLSQHLHGDDMDAVTNDMNAFVSQYDKDVRDYTRAASSPAGGDMKWVNSNIPSPIPSYSGQRVDYCYADYLIAFRADGSVEDAWMLDAFPDAQTGRRLLASTFRLRLAATEGTRAPRYVEVPVMYGVAVINNDPRLLSH